MTAAGFLALGSGAVISPPLTWHLVLITVAISCLIAGHLLASPTALSSIPRFAGDHPTGTYFGLLASLGGIAVLLASGFSCRQSYWW